MKVKLSMKKKTKLSAKLTPKKLSMSTLRVQMSNLWIAIQQRRPETAHQMQGEALLPKTSCQTIKSSESTVTIWQSCQIGCAGRLRKANATSLSKVTIFQLGKEHHSFHIIWPDECISSQLTLASAFGIPLLRPDPTWSGIGLDHLLAAISLSWNFLISSKLTESTE